MNIVKVISTRVADGFRNVKFLRMGKSDIQETEQIGSHGFDSNPVKDMVAIYAPTLQQGEPVILGYINKNHIDLKPGESSMYSTDSDGQLKTFIKLLDDATMEIGGNSDFMVRFNELKSGFDQLKNDFNTHTHITTATIGASPTPGTIAPPTSPSAASIDNSKISEIKTL